MHKKANHFIAFFLQKSSVITSYSIHYTKLYEAGLQMAPNGGIVVDDRLQAFDRKTRKPDEQIFAIGECGVIGKIRQVGRLLEGALAASYNFV